MSAHTLLVMHNIQVLDAFFAGVRTLLGSPETESSFAAEVEKFTAFYDDGAMLLEEATADWKTVDLARGKGRLAREKAQEAESNPNP
jgi:queuine tRNA-ribosyltransferase